MVFGSFWVFRGFLAGTAVQLAGRACSPAGRQDTDGMCRARSPGVPGGGCPPVGQEARAPSAPAKKNLSRASSRRCRARMVFPPLSLTAQGLFFSGGWPQAGLGAVRAPRCLLLLPSAPKKCPLRGTAPGCGAGEGSRTRPWGAVGCAGLWCQGPSHQAALTAHCLAGTSGWGAMSRAPWEDSVAFQGPAVAVPKAGMGSGCAGAEAAAFWQLPTGMPTRSSPGQCPTILPIYMYMFPFYIYIFSICG